MKHYFWKSSLLATALLISIVTGKKVWAQNQYPEEVQRTFVNDCTQSGTSQGADVNQIQPICVCVLNGIQQEFTYPEFQEIEKKLAAGEEAPPKLYEVMNSCVEPRGE